MNKIRDLVMSRTKRLFLHLAVIMLVFSASYNTGTKKGLGRSLDVGSFWWDVGRLQEALDIGYPGRLPGSRSEEKTQDGDTDIAAAA
jgi:hypothetical protein